MIDSVQTKISSSIVIFRFCIVEPARCGSIVVEIFGFGFVKTDLN
jgi:hypothetical protein